MTYFKTTWCTLSYRTSRARDRCRFSRRPNSVIYHQRTYENFFLIHDVRKNARCPKQRRTTDKEEEEEASMSYNYERRRRRARLSAESSFLHIINGGGKTPEARADHVIPVLGSRLFVRSVPISGRCWDNVASFMRDRWNVASSRMLQVSFWFMKIGSR